MSIPEPSADHLNTLRKYFGHTQFRPMQWKIIHSLLEKKQDNCVVMATGYGKSLCYQYPAVYRNGLSIVISPLISLMQDQVLSLQMSNIPACYFGSAQTARAKSLQDVLRGDCRVLYITPEWFISDGNRELLLKIERTVNITLIAIDEAHCVSQWGHDFRPSYRQLGNIRRIISNVPILAVTASATPQVKLDICKSLNLRNAQVICTGFDRPNLYFAVSTKTNDVFRDIEKLLVQGKGFTYKFPGPTIIYCPTKKATEKVAEDLNSHGIRCAPYHADLSLKTRQSVHEEFVKDQLPVVVATVAFGMGIDKPNVRCVIHYGAPKDIESYYQEVGRAGRDGLPSTCHVYFADSDFSLQRYFTNTGSTNASIRDHRERMVRLMQQYLQTRECRRQLLLSYFTETAPDLPTTLSANCCDNCARQLRTGKTSKPQISVVEEAKLFLQVMELFNGRFGLGIPIKFIRGMKDPKIYASYLNNPLYGSGKANSEVAWKALGRLCLRDGLLKEISCNSGFGARKPTFLASTVAITEIGKKFITKGEDCGVKLIPTAEIEMLFKKKPKLPIETDRPGSSGGSSEVNQKSKQVNKEREQQAALFSVLKRLRDELAQDYNCSPHMIATDIALHKIATQKPSTIADLAQIGEFNEAKLQKFGNHIIQKVREFCGQTTDPDFVNQIQFEDADDFDNINPEFFDNMPDYSKTQVSINQYQAEDDPDSMDFEFPDDSDFVPNHSTTDNYLPANRTNTNVISKYPTNHNHNQDNDLTDFEDDSLSTGKSTNFVPSTRPNQTKKTNINTRYGANFYDDDDLTDFEDESIPAGRSTTYAPSFRPNLHSNINVNSNNTEDEDLTDFEDDRNPANNRVEFPSGDDDDLEIPDMEPSSKPASKPQPVNIDDDYWGNISDELFESIPLDQLSQTTKEPTPPVPQQPPTHVPDQRVTAPPEVKRVKFNPKIQYDTDSDDDDVSPIGNNAAASSSSLNTFNSGSLKLEMPAWLTKPTAKDEIKKRVKSNSLFKK
ncbi:bifunctional 3'-5' exonuclease/ATP-dependent helicase WRN-like [Planococcus citri]|uniref:bifunctional 3'-5' exonuclease/ATP-dependent helicase WRN-like n=1 Tax=Planococcus citri TaxID=170843 RepID=UPI0031F98C88